MPLKNDYDHAVSIDKNNGNHLWTDCAKLEIDQHYQHDAYKDMGIGQAPKCNKKIRTHFVFDGKHDDRHTYILVSDGHLTDIPLSSVYPGMASLRGIRLVLFLAELNGIESWGTDTCNAYLE